MAAYAAGAGSLPCLQYVAERGCPLDSKLYLRAVSVDAFGCVQFLHEQNIPFPSVYPNDFVLAAVCKNNLQCLAFALQEGCTFQDGVLTFAQSDQWTEQSIALMAYSDVNKLKYLHERGCPWDENVFIRAISSYSSESGPPMLNCIIYAHENGCPWSRNVSLQAVYWNHIPAVEYLLTHGCPLLI